jgi:hypothetical protein
VHAAKRTRSARRANPAQHARSAHRAIGFLLALGIALAANATAAADGDPRPRGDVSARSFAEYCQGDLPAPRRARFDRGLETAEAALARGDTGSAEAALSDAFSAAYRGGAETAVSIKCLGEGAARRWLDAQLELDRRKLGGALADLPDRRVASESALRLIAIDRGEDALVERIRGLEPRRFSKAWFALEEIVRRLEADRSFGAFMLPREETLERVAGRAMERLRPIADAGHRDALAREKRIFDGRETRRERDAAAAVESASALAEAFAGPGASLPTDEATVAVQSRTRRSLEALHEARDWNLDRSAERSSTPESIRARQRGDELLERAGGSNASLALQDACYGAAERYYDFGAQDERAKAAREKRLALEPALRAARAERERAADEAADRLRSEADAIQRSAEDMMKSESEKKAFEEEADALEDELGF